MYELPFTPKQLSSQRFWDNMERVTAQHNAAIEQDLAQAASWRSYRKIFAGVVRKIVGKSRPSPESRKKVEEILHGRYMADLFRTHIHTTRQALPRLQFQFRLAAYQKLRSTLLGKTILFTDHGEDRSDEQIVLGYRAHHPPDRPETARTRLLLRLGAHDPQSPAPQTSQVRNRTQHGGNDEAAHLYPGNHRALSSAATRPTPLGASRAVEAQPQATKDRCRTRPRSLSQQLGHTLRTGLHPRQ
jgi:hypothetical protein